MEQISRTDEQRVKRPLDAITQTDRREARSL